MEYAEIQSRLGTYECVCKAGFTKQGTICVTDADFNTLVNRLPFGGIADAKKTTFNSILSHNGLSTSKSEEFISDVFSTYFVDGSIGCIIHNIPIKC